ncbi:hypothetical protein [Deinococcus koreensis]|nr:hypothetical protein [Deinococcus koreensis]
MPTTRSHEFMDTGRYPNGEFVPGVVHDSLSARWRRVITARARLLQTFLAAQLAVPATGRLTLCSHLIEFPGLAGSRPHDPSTQVVVARVLNELRGLWGAQFLSYTTEVTVVGTLHVHLLVDEPAGRRLRALGHEHCGLALSTPVRFKELREKVGPQIVSSMLYMSKPAMGTCTIKHLSALTAGQAEATVRQTMRAHRSAQAATGRRAGSTRHMLGRLTVPRLPGLSPRQLGAVALQALMLGRRWSSMSARQILMATLLDSGARARIEAHWHHGQRSSGTPPAAGDLEPPRPPVRASAAWSESAVSHLNPVRVEGQTPAQGGHRSLQARCRDPPDTTSALPRVAGRPLAPVRWPLWRHQVTR